MTIEAHYHWLVAPAKIDWVRETIDPKKIAPDEICCRTLFSGISPGTELAAFDGLEPLRPNVARFPRWLGYMNIAEVIAAGAAAETEFPVGALVYTGAAHRSHFILHSSKVLATIPQVSDVASATLAYLYRLALTGLVRGRGKIVSNCAVVGLGAIGQCAIELAKSTGANCLGISDHEAAQQAARSLGVNVAGRAEAEARFGEQQSEQDLFDQVVVTTNRWRDWKIAMSLARFGAIISVIGFPGRGEPAPDFNPLLPALFYDRQLTIASAGFASPVLGEGRESPASLRKDMNDILNWIAARRINPARLVVGTRPAPDLTGAYFQLKAAQRAVGTFVLDWSRS
jgi:threonine dehydrogenase-like Zn-dependent dehydrogenase